MFRLYKLVPDCYKTQKNCNKAVNTYPSTTKFVPECYKTQEICNRIVYEDQSEINFDAPRQSAAASSHFFWVLYLLG